MLESPFDGPGNWYRANLHAHTTASDGDLSPEEAVEWYRSAGYDVLAITDHYTVTTVSDPPPGLLVLRGLEFGLGSTRQGTDFHIVGLDVEAGAATPPPEAGPQEVVDFLRARGGEAILAHPYWSGLMAEDIEPLRGCFALEVYNTGCDLGNLRGYSVVHWDDLLTLGYAIGGVATDDGHRHRHDHGGGWTMIRAQELSASAVMDALRRGRYYASTGPEILAVELTQDKVRVETSPVASIALVSAPWNGGRQRAEPGALLTSAEFGRPGARYCRVEVMDAQGRAAWSNPFLLGG